MSPNTKAAFITVLLWHSVGCGADAKNDTTKNDDASTDIDGDGYPSTTDCDDTNPDKHPNAEERCDGIDNDCDEIIDEEPVDGIHQWKDDDGDGHGQPESGITECSLMDGYVELRGDCDDDDPSVSPDAAEVCDEVDNNCDGRIDEYSALDARNWFLDSDGDGFGGGPPIRTACGPQENEVEFDGDCDDNNVDVHPSASERCDEIDNNCDGDIDESGAIGATIHYRDADRDGFGNAADTDLLCAPTEDYIAIDGDCDDTESAAFPGAPEMCDSMDNSCSGFIDDRCASEHDVLDAIWMMEPTQTAFTVGDLSGDGVMDLLTTDASSASFSLYMGPLTSSVDEPTWTATPLDSTTGSGVTVRADQDIDDDGQVDLVTAYPYLSGPESFSEIRIHLGPLSGTPNMDAPDIRLRTEEISSHTLNPSGMWFSDITVDDSTDILMYTSPENALLLWPNPSGEMSTEADIIQLATIDTNPVSSLSTTDYTGDGIADLVIGYPGTGTVDFFDGPIHDAVSLYTEDQSITMDDPNFGVSLCTGDLMDDGHTSIAIATRGDSETPSEISVYSSDDDFEDELLTLIGRDRHHIGTQTKCDDIDGDGRMDLLTSHQSIYADDGGMAGTITLIHGSISPFAGSVIEVSESADHIWIGEEDDSFVWLGSSMLAGDLNHDGVGDIVTTAGSNIYIFSGSDWISDSWTASE